MLDCDEFKRWIGQGDHTFSLIDSDIEKGGYEWACFKAQQSAEMSIKAVLKSFGKEGFGHGLLKLFGECEEILGRNRDVRNGVSYLDKLYITPRYPDAFTEGSPWEHFTENDAELAKNAASKVIKWAKEVLSQCL